MLYVLGAIVVFFVSKLLWKAFQGTCQSNGVSEASGAISTLKWLVIIFVVGTVGLFALANGLSWYYTGH